MPLRSFGKTLIIFLTVFLVSLLIWIQVKDAYSYGICAVASKFVGGIKDARVEAISRDDEVIEITFSPRRRGSDMLVDVPVKTSAYTFNVPLTLGIMGALTPFMKRRVRAYGEALILLGAIHFLYVFSLGALQLTQVFMETGIEGARMTRSFIYEFLWGFTDNMLVRFEPFLLGFYVFMRFAR